MAKKIKFKVVAKPKNMSSGNGGILTKQVAMSVKKINDENKKQG